jgi:RND family efflux transporter MFP subunit
MKKRLNLPAFIILSQFIIALMLLTSCNDSKDEQTIEMIKPVRYQEITFASGNTVRSFLGTARSDKEINLSFRTSGILTTLNINVGRKVLKGNLLAQLDNAEAILSLEQAIASENSAKSNLNTATSTLERTRTLYEKGSASLSDYENAKSSYASAEANYESAYRSVDIRRKQVSYGVIYAPATGIIASRPVEINENVSAGQVVAVLNAGNKMEVSLGVPENVINLLNKDMTVEIAFTALKNKRYKGFINEIAPSLDANTSTYPIRVRISSPSPEIKSGMAANVFFSFAEKTDLEALIAPVAAVGEDSEGNFVFLIQSEDGLTGTVTKHHFTIGELTPKGFIIKEGLALGDRVATAGLQTLLDGQKVKLQ